MFILFHLKLNKFHQHSVFQKSQTADKQIVGQLSNLVVMETLNLPTLLLQAGELRPGDVVGFTFFTGYMAMFAASVFFFFERSQVEGHWKTSLLISGLITMIAAVHYFYMRD